MSDFCYSSMQLHNMPVTPAVMATYRCKFNFALLLHILVLSSVMSKTEQVLSTRLFILNQIHMESRLGLCFKLKLLLLNNAFRRNQKFVSHVLVFFAFMQVTWLICLLFEAGDIHPNPGPSTSSSISSISQSSLNNSFTAILSSFHHLLFVPYNVQSIYNKVNTLSVELSEFDILAFIESWLHPGIPDEDLKLPTYHRPERKDRNNDPHGGVLIYIKDSIHYKRRLDLELPGIECIWVEIIMKNKRLLFGLFYRPPSADAIHNGLIEDSNHLAIDTGTPDIVITGDFNYNVLSEPTRGKVASLCQQFSLSQHITEPTHYTEKSACLLDIIMVSNSNSLHLTGVGDPFLS